jgi:hypothetical protein
MTSKLQKSVEAEGRKTNSYVYDGSNIEDLMKALDPEWPGAIPHTLVIATDGSVVYRHNGEINGEELRAKILEHLGDFYLP